MLQTIIFFEIEKISETYWNVEMDQNVIFQKLNIWIIYNIKLKNGLCI